MTALWSVRRYKDGDEHGILELMKLIGNERTIEHWFWEYKENPFGHFICVAEYSGEIVGHMALIPTLMKIGEKTMMGSQAVDLVVHPKFRRQKMFLTIGKILTKEARRNNIHVSYGFPNKLAHAGHLKYGWFDVCTVPLLIKPINMNKLVDFLVENKRILSLDKYKVPKSIAKYMLKIFITIRYFSSRAFCRIKDNIRLQDVEVHAVTSFENRINDFWKRVSGDLDIVIIRNRKYLNWRYFRKPDTKYIVLLAEKNEEILGYVVLLSKNEKKSFRLGYIVDVLASSDNENVIQALVSKALEHFREEKVDAIISMMLKNNPFYKVLVHNGFAHIRSIAFIARVNSSELSETFFKNQTKWYITMGDSDWI